MPKFCVEPFAEHWAEIVNVKRKYGHGRLCIAPRVAVTGRNAGVGCQRFVATTLLGVGLSQGAKYSGCAGVLSGDWGRLRCGNQSGMPEAKAHYFHKDHAMAFADCTSVCNCLIVYNVSTAIV